MRRPCATMSLMGVVDHRLDTMPWERRGYLAYAALSMSIVDLSSLARSVDARLFSRFIGAAHPVVVRIGLVRIPRPADGRVVLFEHGGEYILSGSQRHSNSSVLASTSRSTSADSAVVIRLGVEVGLCETSSSWRLLLCEASASGLVTARASRAVRSACFQFS